MGGPGVGWSDRVTRCHQEELIKAVVAFTWNTETAANSNPTRRSAATRAVIVTAQTKTHRVDRQ